MELDELINEERNLKNTYMGLKDHVDNNSDDLI
jgi:hypothetical protein